MWDNSKLKRARKARSPTAGVDGTIFDGSSCRTGKDTLGDEKTARRDTIHALALWLLAVGLYVLTLPGNYGDTEDAYAYASWLIPDRANYALWDHHHNLYLPLMKLSFSMARRALPSLQPFEWLLGISVLFGALSVAGTYLFCRRRQNLSGGVSVVAAFMLLVSYGFWRYSCAPEVYTLSTFLVLVALYQVFSNDTSFAGCARAAVLGALAVGIHIGNAPAVFLVGTAWAWRRKGARRAAMYLGIVLALTLSHYALPVVFPKQVRTVPALVATTGPAVEACARPYAALPAPARLLMGPLCLPQAWVAPNFLLGFGSFRHWLRAAFAHRNMDEELFLGNAFDGDPLLLAACVTLLLLLVAVTWLGLSLLRHRRRADSPADSPDTWLLAWFALNSAMILWKEPDNPELWIFSLPPLLLWMVGSVGRILPPALALRHLATIATLLAAHNWLGGIRILADPSTDLNRQIAAAFQGVADEGDVIITARGPISRTYLEYYTRAQVIDIQGGLLKADIVLPSVPGDRKIWAASDVFDPPGWLERSSPGLYSRMEAWGRRHKSVFAPVASNDIVVVYAWTGNHPDPNEEN